eukprot:SAG31_NODE_677_length_12894_cov_4.083548_12_plen_101_part_00
MRVFQWREEPRVLQDDWLGCWRPWAPRVTTNAAPHPSAIEPALSDAHRTHVRMQICTCNPIDPANHVMVPGTSREKHNTYVTSNREYTCASGDVKVVTSC